MNLTIPFLIIILLGTTRVSYGQNPSDTRARPIDDFFQDPLKKLMQSVQPAGQDKKEGVPETNINSEKPIRNPFIPVFPELRQAEERNRPIHTPSLPTVPLPTLSDSSPPKKARPSFKIQGLVWNTKKPQAIINDQVFNIGDAIDSWTITAIGKSGISVSSENITFVIEP